MNHKPCPWCNGAPKVVGRSRQLDQPFLACSDDACLAGADSIGGVVPELWNWRGSKPPDLEDPRAETKREGVEL